MKLGHYGCDAFYPICIGENNKQIKRFLAYKDAVCVRLNFSYHAEMVLRTLAVRSPSKLRCAYPWRQQQ
jgi:hypothetical protein